MLNFHAYPFVSEETGKLTLFNLHTHSTYSDGANTPEEIILTALERGLTCIGFSEHSYVEMDDSSMKEENVEAYQQEITRLKPIYNDWIKVLCGLERDYYSEDFRNYDYVIGSVHWVRMPDGHRMCVDWTADRLERDVQKYFDGDWYAMTEAYYAVEADVIRRTKCDIIGHFDLVTKFNEQRHYFDTNHPRYVAAWKKAAEALLPAGIPFEINTGAMSKGYRTEPYPAAPIREYLRERGATLILSSDAHQKENLLFAFDRYCHEATIGV